VFGRSLWLPESYNLETQLPNFIGDYLERKKGGKSLVFIVKPWNLARGIGHVITDNIDCVIRLMETGPKIACEYITNPSLYEDLKYDLRFIALLRSVDPLEIYVYKPFLVRFANKPFSMDEFEDYEKHMTVMTFTPYNLKEIEHTDFISTFEKAENTLNKPKTKWEKVEKEIHKIIYDTLVAAKLTKNGGLKHRPHSGAIYGFDIILDEDNNGHLLEVNYCPNCVRLQKYNPLFFEGVFKVLFTNNNTNMDEFIQL